MLLDQGKSSLPSKMGTLCSFLLLVAMLAYTSYKMYILEGKKSINIVQAVKENHFDDTHKFGSEQGMNLAVAVFNALDLSTNQPLDPSYGRIRFMKLEWGQSESG